MANNVKTTKISSAVLTAAQASEPCVVEILPSGGSVTHPVRNGMVRLRNEAGILEAGSAVRIRLRAVGDGVNCLEGMSFPPQVTLEGGRWCVQHAPLISQITLLGGAKLELFEWVNNLVIKGEGSVIRIHNVMVENLTTSHADASVFLHGHAVVRGVNARNSTLLFDTGERDSKDAGWNQLTASDTHLTFSGAPEHYWKYICASGGSIRGTKALCRRIASVGTVLHIPTARVYSAEVPLFGGLYTKQFSVMLRDDYLPKVSSRTKIDGGWQNHDAMDCRGNSLTEALACGLGWCAEALGDMLQPDGRDDVWQVLYQEYMDIQNALLGLPCWEPQDLRGVVNLKDWALEPVQVGDYQGRVERIVTQLYNNVPGEAIGSFFAEQLDILFPWMDLPKYDD